MSKHFFLRYIFFTVSSSFLNKKVPPVFNMIFFYSRFEDAKERLSDSITPLVAPKKAPKKKGRPRKSRMSVKRYLLLNISVHYLSTCVTMMSASLN